MNEHDRTPSPPLAEADLQQIEQEFRSGETYSEDLPRFVASLRAAWAERDEFRASFLELYETTRRYREALETQLALWETLASPQATDAPVAINIRTAARVQADVLRAALTPPDASAGASS